MDRREPNVDDDLSHTLSALSDAAELDVLVYPARTSEDLENFLAEKKGEGVLDYNILRIANSIAVKGSKRAILEIAARGDVLRVSTNPRMNIDLSSGA